MYFDDAKTSIACATRGRGKRGDDFPNTVACKRVRLRIIIDERNRAGRHDVCPAAFTLGNRAVAFPWPTRARLATGVRELHPRSAALRMNKAHDVLEFGDVIVAPNAEVMRTDAALGQDRGRFCQHESCATHGTAAEMHKAPVVSQSVSARVLTHWRDKDAIGEL